MRLKGSITNRKIGNRGNKICIEIKRTDFLINELVINNSIHKPPALPVRIEKVLPLPGDHCFKPERCRRLMNGINQISDHQQSVAPAPSRGLPHTPSSAGGR